ncbi:Vms1/Ankzf1 family peptidyl-tRNA hydrolase [uncultured Methanomethylovorans sp.]|uniref:baeRF10 domain-containing protein n=1 Tax=uncultured Methanomethylovorans sp. TaxID=183759 RepID=UPI002AA89961|nr:Vms1/Ankzf1 family peptidyl-tRNA hydrolase [uncultured Methanomethylovorans sp.]
MHTLQNLQSIISNDLVSVTEIDIRVLSEMSSEKPVYVSIYLPTSGKENDHLNKLFVESRIKAIRKALPTSLLDQFEKTYSMIEEWLLEKPVSGEKGRIIFACFECSFLQVYRIAVETDNYLVVDTSPFILPLGRLRADFEDYGILLVDSREAKFFCIRSDIIKEHKHLSTDLMNKHKKGGWSQMRFNHLRKGAIKSFLSEVINNIHDTCDQFPTKGIVIAGPGEAKHQLIEMLPKEVKQKLLGVMDIPMNIASNELVAAGDEILHEDEMSTSKRRAEEFRREILRGGLAVHGLKSVKESLEQGKVNVLFILQGLSVPGWICKKCHNLQASAKIPTECKACSGHILVVNVLEKLFELAQKTGAEVEFVKPEELLDSTDIVAALLRY